MARWVAALLLGLSSSARAADITVQGSDTMVALSQRWAEAYMSAHPPVSIQVNGGGSGTGIAALVNRTADIATASRRIRSREVEGCVKSFGARPREYAVALDALVLHVHRSNAVPALDMGQLAGLYSGRIRNWRAVGGADRPVVLYGRESSSGTYEFFKETVLKGDDFAPEVQALQGTAQVLAAVSRDPGGIGYGSAAIGGGTRRIRLAPSADKPGVEASEATVRDGTYPLWRRLYVYLAPADDTANLRDWIAWVRGSDGQRIVGELGFYPLPPDGK